MNFYLDFEATQYTSRIISIGCVDDLGNTFKTLVALKKKDDVGKYVSQLTGITNEMLATAPSADEAFSMFYNWVLEHSDGGVPKYFCYGDADAVFIKNTTKIMSDFQAITFATSICTLMEDYSLFVSEYLQSQQIALKKVVGLVQHSDEVIQSHDALEDAEMLRLVVYKLQTNVPSVSPQLPVLSVVSEPKVNRVPIMPNAPVSILGDPMNYKVKCWSKENIYYFKSFRVAALWVMERYASQTPVTEKTINRVINRICNAVENNTHYNLLGWAK